MPKALTSNSAANKLMLAAWVSFAVCILKAVAFGLTGSLVVLASFLDSAVDAVLSFVNSKMQNFSVIQADREHPYGHGGFVVLSTLIQGFFLAGSGFFLIYKLAWRFFETTAKNELVFEELPYAFVILILGTLLGGFIAYMLGKERKKLKMQNLRSLSIESDFSHYIGDFFHNFLSAAGIGLLWYFKWPAVDQIFGLLAAVILLWSSFPLLKNSFRDIVNQGDEPKIRLQVEKIISESKITEIKGIHQFRTRMLGPTRFIDFHLALPDAMALIQCHQIGYKIEEIIKQEIPYADVTIHLDPESEPEEDF